MTIVVSKIDAKRRPLKVSVGYSVKTLSEGGLVIGTSKGRKSASFRGGILRKECLHLMTFVSKEEKASNAITFGANHRTRTLLSYDHAVKINGNGCMDQQAQSATAGRQPC